MIELLQFLIICLTLGLMFFGGMIAGLKIMANHQRPKIRSLIDEKIKLETEKNQLMLDKGNPLNEEIVFNAEGGYKVVVKRK